MSSIDDPRHPLIERGNGNSAKAVTFTIDDGSATTPEPASMLIVGIGIVGLGLASRRRKK